MMCENIEIYCCKYIGVGIDTGEYYELHENTTKCRIK